MLRKLQGREILRNAHTASAHTRYTDRILINGLSHQTSIYTANIYIVASGDPPPLWAGPLLLHHIPTGQLQVGVASRQTCMLTRHLP